MKNILLITVDSLRADHLNYYGYKSRVTSPNLDEIAKKGYHFENAISHGNNTLSSLPSILTGTYPLSFKKGVKNKITISQILQHYDYKTIALHSNAAVTHSREYDKGFEVFKDLGLNSRFSEYFIMKNGWTLNYTISGKSVPYTPAKDLVDEGLEYINKYKNEKLFLWLFFMDVHHPYLPPAEFDGPKNPLSRMRAIRLYQKARTYFAGGNRNKKLSDEEKERIKKLYDGCIQYVDQQIGRLIKNLDDDWIVIITSDHGDELFDRGWFGHGTSFYEELIHIPLIIYDGDNKSEIKNVVGHMDILPTVLGLLNVEKPKTVHGINAIQEKRNAVIGEKMSKKGKALFYRGNRWKLIRDDRYDIIELYDLKNDPEERNNLTREETDTAVELLKELEKHEKWEKKEGMKFRISEATKKL